MKRIYIYILAYLLSVASTYAQSEIVTDFKPACDSLAVLLQERTSVHGTLELRTVMRRGSSLDFYFT